MAGLITLTTDFGLRDPFVGIMKGVLLSICPSVRLVDLTHEVPP
ncbi:MAG TPA: SAM-dependent chlorinase/fluorinase, partial [Candidatus Eisenbacteria bacterium]|nr:SAM-dependent chlorinase/fluorinase [Candidatus Eisenbacteria bacterium]